MRWGMGPNGWGSGAPAGRTHGGRVAPGARRARGPHLRGELGGGGGGRRYPSESAEPSLALVYENPQAAIPVVLIYTQMGSCACAMGERGLCAGGPRKGRGEARGRSSDLDLLGVSWDCL